MGFARQYIEEHFARGRYQGRVPAPGCERYLHTGGWEDAVASESMIFSYRSAFFDNNRFTNAFHAHPYYEMVIFHEGDVEYLNEEHKIRPHACTVIWNAPSQMHTAHLLSPCTYKRFVLCFDPDFFGDAESARALLGFMHAHPQGALHPDKRDAERLLALLWQAKAAADDTAPFAPLLLRARLVELFAALGSPTLALCSQDAQSTALAPVKQYIDREYATIRSTGEIAARFFYSREHLSRRFRAEYNIPISEYLSKRRVLESLSLLQTQTVAQAAYAVGFRSQSAFITAFKHTMGCLPSAYLREQRP